MGARIRFPYNIYFHICCHLLYVCGICLGIGLCTQGSLHWVAWHIVGSHCAKDKNLINETTSMKNLSSVLYITQTDG